MAEAGIALTDLRSNDAARVGHKAVRLGELARAGFAVPPGFAIPVAICASESSLRAAIAEAVASLGDVALAVRSSALSEDQADASFAGLYETVLDVRGVDAGFAAALRCVRSAHAPRVRAHGGAPQVGLIVQELVRADAAGVAFSANPVTGARDEVVLSAVRGLGDVLVDGARSGEEWRVRGDEPTRVRGDEAVLDAQVVRRLATLARTLEARFGAPQDIEWAVAGDELFVVQSRPIVALPRPVEWKVPHRGGWLRHFRLGEWLPDPVTPLFASWFIPMCERAFLDEQERACGLRPPGPHHALVEGWYYCAPIGTGGMASMLRGFLRHPAFFFSFLRASREPEGAERRIAAPHAQDYRERVLPAYRALVAACTDEAEPSLLAAQIDRVAELAGKLLWSFAMVGGFAWKAEAALARFFVEHLATKVEGSYQRLLAGLTRPSAPLAHAVHSIDWSHPTQGERAESHFDLAVADARFAASSEERTRFEARCRTALSSSSSSAARFDRLLAIARRYAVLREEEVSDLTLAWPAMRKVLLRLGAQLVERGILGDRDQIFFLTKEELDAALEGQQTPRAETAVARVRVWRRRRSLSPPLAMGTLFGPIGASFLGAVAVMRTPSATTGRAIEGMPASPGRAEGRVRIIRGPSEFDRLREGEVLVAPTTGPSWTPLFLRAAAIVTDGGSVLAHASLIAREYGVPAVVGTTDATSKLCDGMWVVVDGSAGVVIVAWR